MTTDFFSLAVSGVQQLHPYQPGKPIEEVQREFGLTDVIKLASNENPLGPSPRGMAAAQQALQHVHLYPDGSGFALKKKLSSQLGVAAEQITLGNGSNEILELLARVFLRPGDSAVISEYAFIVYPLAIIAQSATIKLAQAKHWGHDLDAMLAQIDAATRLVFIANPNNPTGTWVSYAALESFMQQVPANVVIVLDEAYCEYVTEPTFATGLSLLSRYPNLVITRTFSKAYGLAGLRAGYAVSCPQIADLLNRLREPFNMNSLALAAAEAALDDHAFLARSREVNSAGMLQLEQGLQGLGFNYIPSIANFIAVEFKGDTAAHYQYFLRHGIIVRPVGVYGMKQHLRISIGLATENQRFLDALATLEDV